MPAKERMKAMRERLRQQTSRESRLLVPDGHSTTVRRRVPAEVARLRPESERDALAWIEAVSEFDSDASAA
jgi:hypothetical protein